MLKCFYCGANTVEIYEETIAGEGAGFRAHCNLCGMQGQTHVVAEDAEDAHRHMLNIFEGRCNHDHKTKTLTWIKSLNGNVQLCECGALVDLKAEGNFEHFSPVTAAQLNLLLKQLHVRAINEVRAHINTLLDGEYYQHKEK